MRQSENSGIDREPRVRIAVAIATVGRPQLLGRTLSWLRAQSYPAVAIYVCAPSVADVEGIPINELEIELLVGVHGSCVQRNAIIERVTDFDVIAFFDDDFVPRSDYLERMAEIFSAHPEVVVATGHVVADGANGPGYEFDQVEAILERDAATARAGPVIREVYNGYGCNMAVRAAVLQRHSIFFDELLPLYGWLEDVDLSRRLARHGRIVAAAQMRGVHLGTKKGKQPGKRLGYSQIANPVYLARKGTLSWPRALRQLVRNVAANLLGTLRPEPYIDRRGRAVGNAIAFRHLLAGKLDPRRVLSVDPSRS